MTEETIEGRNPVTEALVSGTEIDKIYLSKSANTASLSKLLRLAKERNVPISYADSKKIETMSTSGNCQGVVAVISEVKYSTVDDILSDADKSGEPPFVIIADEITDPHNLGAIIRSAAAVGAHGVIIPTHRSAGVNSVVSKTSAGAVSHIKIAKVNNIAKTIEDLQKKGLWIYGAAAEGEKTIYEENLKGACALVVGSEGKGIGRLIKEKCDFLLRIPMKSEIESLNASVAAAIFMYEIRRQRNL